MYRLITRINLMFHLAGASLVVISLLHFTDGSSSSTIHHHHFHHPSFLPYFIPSVRRRLTYSTNWTDLMDSLTILQRFLFSFAPLITTAHKCGVVIRSVASVYVCVCLSVRPVHAVTLENFDTETSFLTC